MSIWNIIFLVGGLAIFLYGMLLMNNGLTAAAGQRLRRVMDTLTRGRVRGYLTGLGVTALNQSSSATTVLEAVLVGAGLMTFEQSLAVTLGAEVASTFLGQLVAFPKITHIAPLIIAGAFFTSLVVKTQRARSITTTLIGFGLLLWGMELMSTSLEPLRRFRPFLNLMVTVSHPLVGIAVGLVFTMIVQSSGATSGLTIAMALSGTITLAQAVPINMGASVGTCITAVIGSMALNREAKRTAYIHVMFQTISLILVYVLLMIPFQGDRLWLVLVRWVTSTLVGTDSLTRQVAMAHTMMPILNDLVVFPLLPLLTRFYNKIYPPLKSEASFGPVYLTEGLVEQPEIGIEQAKKETMRVVGIVTEMLERCRRLFVDQENNKTKEREINEISALDGKVDLLRNAIVAFLTRVAGESLSELQSRRVVLALNTINELENLADVIDINILDRARKLFFDLQMHMSDEGTREFASLHGMVVDHFQEVMSGFEAEKAEVAVKFLSDRAPFRELQAEIRMRQFRRLRDGNQLSLETNPVYMDLMNHYNRINRHIIHIAKRMAENLAKPAPQRQPSNRGEVPSARPRARDDPPRGSSRSDQPQLPQPGPAERNEE